MNCTPIWTEHVDRQRPQRRRRLDMAINRLKTNLELIINAGSAKSDLLGSDQNGAERSGSPSIGGRTAKCCCRCCHSLALARGRGSGSCLTGWRSWMKAKNTHTKLWAKSQTQSCVVNVRIRIRNTNLFFVLVFFIYSYFVCGFGDLQSVKLICQHDNNSQKP